MGASASHKLTPDDRLMLREYAQAVIDRSNLLGDLTGTSDAGLSRATHHIEDRLVEQPRREEQSQGQSADGGILLDGDFGPKNAGRQNLTLVNLSELAALRQWLTRTTRRRRGPAPADSR